LELKKSDFKTRFAFCVLILFSKRKGWDSVAINMFFSFIFYRNNIT
jgi:hypothetical protein